MELNEQQQVRLEKVERLREQGVDPYPPRSGRTHTAQEAVDRYEAGEDQFPEGRDPETVTVAGRVQTVRDMGRSIFAHLEDGSGSIQIYLRKNSLGEEAFERFSSMVDRGDFVEASGHLFRTRTGEVTIEADAWSLLSKAISPPPEKWHGLSDVEQRYRQRYVDLFSNPEVREIFRTRSRMITALRSYLDAQEFLEVETPTLQPVYGGAFANPFTTYHNALDQTLYLRIADELYLKRLIVGGFERVYEICKDFRNEGVDRNHQPEFTMLEFYMAYADYEQVMQLAEAMLIDVIQQVKGSTKFEFGEHEIDVASPWRRLKLADAIFEATNIDIQEVRDRDELEKLARDAGAELEPGTVWPKIVDELMKTFVRPKLIQPTFLIDYPVELSPLAKRIPGSDRTVERFQIFLGGVEIANAYSELNDPIDQHQRFVDQMRQREEGDEETMPLDFEYVDALMYGMPPTGGFGLGLDRLAMILANQRSIREVILFPAMRSQTEAAVAGSED